MIHFGLCPLFVAPDKSAYYVTGYQAADKISTRSRRRALMGQARGGDQPDGEQLELPGKKIVHRFHRIPFR